MYFVCLLIDEAPTKFRFDRILLSLLCRAERCCTAAVLTTAAAKNILWVQMHCDSAGGRFHQARCAASFCSSTMTMKLGLLVWVRIFEVDFSPVYVCGCAPEFPDSTHTDTILLLSLTT